MASSHFEIDFLGTKEAQDKLLTIKRLSGGLEEFFGDVGEHLLETTRQRFDDKVDPDGNDWKPLSDERWEQKYLEGKNPDKILVYEGDLRKYLRYQASDDGLEFGSDRVYAAAHQFVIGPRPFLGITDENKAEIEKMLIRHFEAAIA